jgi:hypothetical protein
MTVLYRIDDRDRLVAVGGDWNTFAAANDAPELTEGGLLGHSLWSFISGIETRHLFELALKRVRTRQVSMTFPYRCDSPDRRRYCELDVRPGRRGEIEFESRVLREVLRPRVDLLDRRAARGEDLVRMCAWCCRVRRPDALWVDVEEALRSMELLNGDEVPSVTHGICPACQAAVFEELGAADYYGEMRA